MSQSFANTSEMTTSQSAPVQIACWDFPVLASIKNRRVCIFERNIQSLT